MTATALDAQLHYPHLFNLPPPQPLNRVTTCDRHPGQQVTGFCASCLRERLAGLEPATRRLRSSSASSSSASAALRSLFFRPAAHGHTHHNAVDTAASSSSLISSSILPAGLRRCKSFSLGRGATPAAAFEPQRRSCDVRGRSSLGTLFHLDDSRPCSLQDTFSPLPLCSSGAAPDVGEGEIEVESQSRGRLSNVAAPEYREEEEVDVDEEDDRRNREVSAGVEATEVGEDYDGSRGARPQWAAEEAQEEEEEKEMGKKGPVRPMKDHIDLDAHSKKPPPKDLKEIAGSFWLAASVFSKKLQKWRRKQKEKKHRHDTMGAGKTPVIGPVTARPCSRSSRRFSRDAQSEVAADYTFGRRSCDTEPRFSLDAGRVSFDDPRFSWDEPRASWDGYLTGGARRSLSLLPRLPPMLSVLEDAPVVPRSDGQIPVEEDAAATPGGSSQTRDYYLDSSSSQRRRRSLDRSSSRRSSVDAASAAELLKPVSTDARLSTDAKLSPTAMGADEYLHHVSKFERDYNSSSLSALHVDDCWESLEKAGAGGGGGGGTPRKPRVWSKAWSLWGLIHRRRSRGGGGRMVERSLSETWQVLPGEGLPRKFGRSNSSVGYSRHSFHGTGCSTNGGGGTLGITRRSGLEINGHGKKRREEFVLERCQSSRRFSPNHGDGGLPRFYVTPAPPSSTGLPKGRCKSSHAPPRSVLRLY